MGTLALAADERVAGVETTDDVLTVSLMDGRTISVPLVWYRHCQCHACSAGKWEIAGGGYGIHWPEIDEDLTPRACFAGHRRHVKSSPRRRRRRRGVRAERRRGVHMKEYTWRWPVPAGERRISGGSLMLHARWYRILLLLALVFAAGSALADEKADKGEPSKKLWPRSGSRRR